MKKAKKWAAGLCMAAMLAATPALAVCASELNKSNPSGTTTVEANVAESAPENPTYVISIPAKVDFGTISQPNTEGTNYQTTDITVTCSSLEGLQQRQAIAVLVKDATATMDTDPFKLTNANGAELTYDLIMSSDSSNIKGSTWYANGYLFTSFTAAGQSAQNILRLDRGQLYGQDLALYGGKYTGSLTFYTRVAGVGDVH